MRNVWQNGCEASIARNMSIYFLVGGHDPVEKGEVANKAKEII